MSQPIIDSGSLCGSFYHGELGHIQHQKKRHRTRAPFGRALQVPPGPLRAIAGQPKGKPVTGPLYPRRVEDDS